MPTPNSIVGLDSDDDDDDPPMKKRVIGPMHTIESKSIEIDATMIVEVLQSTDVVLLVSCSISGHVLLNLLPSSTVRPFEKKKNS
jgi:hypothetical protein